jgi:hypothetical protein
MKTRGDKMRKFLRDLFSDNNTLNEKSILGYAAFMMMVGALISNIVAVFIGVEYEIHEFIFDGFLIITLGSFGIASVDKYINSKRDKSGLADHPDNQLDEDDTKKEGDDAK